ncbi:MAG: hypothetical protein ACRDRR_22230 [Pseudonocardiaceae bacterium]
MRGGAGSKDPTGLKLSVRHGLGGADLAATLGVSANHAHALVSRACQQLERALTVVILARTGCRVCVTPDRLLTGWDGGLTALWRKRIARHIGHCVACGGTKRREVRASALLRANDVDCTLTHDVGGQPSTADDHRGGHPPRTPDNQPSWTPAHLGALPAARPDCPPSRLRCPTWSA